MKTHTFLTTVLLFTSILAFAQNSEIFIQNISGEGYANGGKYYYQAKLKVRLNAPRLGEMAMHIGIEEYQITGFDINNSSVTNYVNVNFPIKIKDIQSDFDGGFIIHSTLSATVILTNSYELKGLRNGDLDLVYLDFKDKAEIENRLKLKEDGSNIARITNIKLSSYAKLKNGYFEELATIKNQVEEKLKNGQQIEEYTKQYNRLHNIKEDLLKKESLAKKIYELDKDKTAYNSRISKIENQLAQIEKEEQQKNEEKAKQENTSASKSESKSKSKQDEEKEEKKEDNRKEKNSNKDYRGPCYYYEYYTQELKNAQYKDQIAYLKKQIAFFKLECERTKDFQIQNGVDSNIGSSFSSKSTYKKTATDINRETRENIDRVESTYGAIESATQQLIGDLFAQAAARREAENQKIYAAQRKINEYVETFRNQKINPMTTLEIMESNPLLKAKTTSSVEEKEKILLAVQKYGNRSFFFDISPNYKQDIVIIKRTINSAFFEGNTLFLNYTDVAGKATYDLYHLDPNNRRYQPHKYIMDVIVSYDFETSKRTIKKHAIWADKLSIPEIGYLENETFNAEVKKLYQSKYIQPLYSNSGIGFSIFVTLSHLSMLLRQEHLATLKTDSQFLKQFNELVWKDISLEKKPYQKGTFQILIVKEDDKSKVYNGQYAILMTWDDKYLKISIVPSALEKLYSGFNFNECNFDLYSKHILFQKSFFELMAGTVDWFVSTNDNGKSALSSNSKKLRQRQIKLNYGFFIKDDSFYKSFVNSSIKSYLGDKTLLNPVIEVGRFDKLVDYSLIADEKLKSDLQNLSFSNIEDYHSNLAYTPQGVIYKFSPLTKRIYTPSEIVTYNNQGTFNGKIVKNQHFRKRGKHKVKKIKTKKMLALFKASPKTLKAHDFFQKPSDYTLDSYILESNDFINYSLLPKNRYLSKANGEILYNLVIAKKYQISINEKDSVFVTLSEFFEYLKSNDFSSVTN